MGKEGCMTHRMFLLIHGPHGSSSVLLERLVSAVSSWCERDQSKPMMVFRLLTCLACRNRAVGVPA